jgi:hypothetical protein
MTNRDLIIINKDNTITYQGVVYNYITKDDKIIIDGILLYELIHSEMIDFLSNKNIIVKECNEKQYHLLYNVYNSNVLIEKLIVRYNSEYFIYSNYTLTEKSECFDFLSGRNSKIIVKGYYLNSGLDYTTDDNELSRIVDGIIFRNKKYKKIKFIHSDKFIGMENYLKQVFILN